MALNLKKVALSVFGQLIKELFDFHSGKSLQQIFHLKALWFVMWGTSFKGFRVELQNKQKLLESYPMNP